MKRYTVIAYIDGDRGVSVHTFRVEAPNRGAAWDIAVATAAEEIDGTVTEQGVLVRGHEAENLTEVVTYDGWPEEATE